MRFDILSVRSSTYAAVCTFLAAIFTIIAFSTPYWLAADGLIANRKFERIGLWEACFIRLRDVNYLYDRELRGCKWIFDEDYAFLLDLLEPAFFVATQVLYTIGFVFLLLTVIGVLVIQLCFTIDREILAMRILSLVMLVAAVFCTIAVVLFGIKGDDRDWMPDPEHNFLSWSFALAVVGTFFQWVASILFWIEARILSKRELKRDNQMFNMQPTGIKA